MYSNFIIRPTEENQCMTCTNLILKELGKQRGVFGVEVDRIDGSILVTHTDEISEPKLIAAFKEMNIEATKRTNNNIF